MKYLDFAVIYENKTRELETAHFIKALLIKIGFTCDVFHKCSLRRFLVNPKVIIVPYLYSINDCQEFNSFWVKKKRAVINLQYEQVLSDNTLQSNFFEPKNNAKNALHIAWGDQTVCRLEDKAGIDSDHIAKVGNISMVLNEKKYKSFFMSKEMIAKQYNLPLNKKWHLFISSFSYPTLSPEEIEDLKRKIPNNSGFIEVSLKSRKEVLNWICKLCEKKDDTIVIYRPHPNEFQDSELTTLCQKIENFYCISNFSIRQWISVVDSLSCWFSTSIADAYYAQKNCIVLRPYDVPLNFESHLLLGCEKIRTIDEFIVGQDSNDNNAFPVDDDIFTSFYSTFSSDEIIFNFINICQMVYENQEKYAVKQDDRNRFYRIIDNLFADLCGCFDFTKVFGKNRYYHFMRVNYLNKNKCRSQEHQYDKKFNELLNC